MKERQHGCICELNEQGEPIVANYAECPVHKPDAITPKDTADSIFDKMSYARTSTGSVGYIIMGNEEARHGAIVAVEEILNVLDTFQTHEYAKVLIPYYKQVKEEIHNGNY